MIPAAERDAADRAVVVRVGDEADARVCSVGAKDMPLSAALMLASVPVKVIDASPVPSPAVKVRPVSCERVRTPCVAVRVTRTMPVPSLASRSVMLI